MGPSYQKKVIYGQSWAASEQDPMSFRVLGYRMSGEVVQDLAEADDYFTPGPIGVDADGTVFALDPAAGRILKIDPSGRVVQAFGPRESDYVDIDVATATGYVLALTTRPEPGIHVFTTSGEFVKSIACDFNLPLRLQVYPDGSFDVKDFGADDCWWVHHFAPDGSSKNYERGKEFKQEMFTYRDYAGAEYKVRRIGGKQVQVQRLMGNQEQPLLDYTEAYGDLANLVMGFDRSGDLYRLMMVPTDRGNHSYVQVLKLRGQPSTYAVDLGLSSDLSGSLSRVAIDERGSIYYLTTNLQGLQLVRYSLAAGR